mmetsp:Transcript_14571/g.21951  ORF Transcript_14571/g.21951 Transcript_14571/m.21951 type:complete len:188 (+) Transcript_14571:378-941(+)
MIPTNAPSHQPSLRPSHQPSVSKEPSLQPSHEPSHSLEPSLSLEPSRLPSLAPSMDPRSLYELLGNGVCSKGGQAGVFPFMSPNPHLNNPKTYNAKSCASTCTECMNGDGVVTGGSFRGFTFLTDFNACWCHLDFGAAHNPSSAECTGVLVSGVDFGAGFLVLDGTGEITGTGADDILNAVCYKVLE